ASVGTAGLTIPGNTPALYWLTINEGARNMATPVRSTSQKSTVNVKLPYRGGIHLGVQTNPAVQVRSCSGARFLLGSCSMVVSGSATFWSVPACSVPGGENPTKCTGPSKNLSGPYNWTIEGSRKPSPQVLRMVNCSSNGCQRTPTFGTAAFVSLFNHSS